MCRITVLCETEMLLYSSGNNWIMCFTCYSIVYTFSLYNALKKLGSSTVRCLWHPSNYIRSRACSTGDTTQAAPFCLYIQREPLQLHALRQLEKWEMVTHFGRVCLLIIHQLPRHENNELIITYGNEKCWMDRVTLWISPLWDGDKHRIPM